LKRPASHCFDDGAVSTQRPCRKSACFSRTTRPRCRGMIEQCPYSRCHTAVHHPPDELALMEDAKRIFADT